MNQPKGYEVIFNRVGQGLFAEIMLSLSDGRHYNVVYDCGSSSNLHITAALDESIKRSSGDIDLLIISHFDKDHVNGVLSLLERRVVNKIMMPYMSKELRIATAVLKQNCYLTLMQKQFIRNPVKAVADGAKKNEKPPSVYFVRTRGDDDIDDTLQEELNGSRSVNIVNSGDNIFTEVLGGGGSLNKTEFEVIPYNDKQELEPKLYNFISKVSPYISVLLDTASDVEDRQNAFESLKDDYLYTFGKSSYRKNLISLFTYINPIFHSRSAKQQLVAQQHTDKKKIKTNIETGQTGILFTGDGYMNNSARVDRLLKGLGKNEWNLALLQVSHHGAKSSWFRGLCQKLTPAIASFSSDPEKHYRHPHESVVKDFSNQVMIYSDTQRWSKVTCVV